jgi:arylsulfatase A-like enzyme
MSRLSQAPFARIVNAAALAGAAVGLLDGLRAAELAGAPATALVNTALLVAGQDAAVGLLLGAAAGLLVWSSRWGRAVPTPRWAQGFGWVVAGLLVAGAGVAAIGATANSHNRFLGGGVVALAVALTGVVGALIGPALARAIAAGARGKPRDHLHAHRSATAAGLLLAAPLVAVTFAGVAFLLVAATRAPLRGARLSQLMAWVAVVGAVIPFAVAVASTGFSRVSRRMAVPAALVLFVVPAAGLVIARWTQDFRFLRWNDLLTVLAMIAATLALLSVPWPRGTARWQALIGPLVGVAGLALFLAAGASEPARKTAAAHAGLAAPILGTARVALDFDGDGYTFLLGGGDCNDRAADINPGAQEWPDDGVDQNCDGKDASTASIHAQPLHPVPEAIPRDLNLLLVTIDTLRADHLGTYGYQRPTSPAIDALAADGIVFDNGWAHAPSTRYSMPALATGRWPSAISWEDCFGCDRGWPRIGSGQPTIGQVLKGLGYFTGAFYAFSYFRRDYHRGFERGIDDFQDQRADLHVDTNGPMESHGTSARQMADDAIAFFARHRSAPGQAGDPGKWFLWLHFYDPHLGYEHHPEAPAFGNAPADGYDAEIWFTDHHLGRVLEALKQQGMWDRTAVFVTGDHGEGLGEHGINAHGYHLYPPQTKVPFVWHVPGLAPRRVDAPVGHVDVAPTLLNLARGTQVKSFLGRSMLDLMAGTPSASVPVPPVFQEVTFEGPSSPIDGTRRRGLVTRDRHLLWNWMPDNTTECYDLRADPGENRDLWGSPAGGDCPGLKTRLQETVEALSLPLDFAEKMAASVSGPDVAVPPPTHPSANTTIGSVVRFLGYDLLPARGIVAKGNDVEVVYHFQVDQQIPAGWRPFFHLDGPGGMRNLDHVPVGGVFPVERWRPGQRIRDRLHIPIPPNSPAGTYTLYLGFWKGSQRMPISPASAADGANRLRVGSFKVE